ncbi:hypothetical protein [Putridiphycobacter roseus]|nr:hypothetical protein [Putridiphycobacter roseus]
MNNLIYEAIHLNELSQVMPSNIPVDHKQTLRISDTNMLHLHFP